MEISQWLLCTVSGYSNAQYFITMLLWHRILSTWNNLQAPAWHCILFTYCPPPSLTLARHLIGDHTYSRPPIPICLDEWWVSVISCGPKACLSDLLKRPVTCHPSSSSGLSRHKSGWWVKAVNVPLEWIQTSLLWK